MGRGQGRGARRPGPVGLRRRLAGGRRGDPRRSGNSRSEGFALPDRSWRRAPVCLARKWTPGFRHVACSSQAVGIAQDLPVLVRSDGTRPCTDSVGTKRRQTTGSSRISTDISPKSVGKCRHTLSGSAALMFRNTHSAASREWSCTRAVNVGVLRFRSIVYDVGGFVRAARNSGSPQLLNHALVISVSRSFTIKLSLADWLAAVLSRRIPKSLDVWLMFNDPIKS